MGFLSSKKITVFSSSCPIIPEPGDPIKEAVIHAILSKGDIVPAVTQAVKSGMAIKGKAGFEYARDHYVLGLPDGAQKGQTCLPPRELAPIITDDLGFTVGVNYSFIERLTPELSLLSYMTTTRRYNQDLGVITEFSDFDLPAGSNAGMFVENMELSADRTQITIHYVYHYRVRVYGGGDVVDDNETYTSEEMAFEETVPVPSGMVLGTYYCIASYYQADGLGNRLSEQNEVWYHPIAGTPYITLAETLAEAEEQYLMPVIPLRRDNVDLTAGAHENNELHISSKKLLNKLGLDMDYMAERLNANPDIAEIDHAYITFTVNLLTDDPIEIKYLIKFFSYLESTSIYSAINYRAAIAARRTPSVNIFGSSLVTKTPPADLSLLEMGLDLEISYGGIESRTVRGKLGPIGTAITHSHVDYDSSYETYQDFGEERTRYVRTDISYVILRHQYSDNWYEEVKILAPACINRIYRNRYVYTNVEHAKENENNILFIPLHYGIANAMTRTEKNLLFATSLRMIMNSYVITKLKWYQSSWFKGLITMVGAYFTMVSGQAWVMGLVEALKEGAMILVMNLLKSLAVAALVDLGMDYISDILPVEVLAVAAIVAFAAAQGLKADFTFGEFAMPNADTLMKFSSVLVKTADMRMKKDAASIQKKFLDLDEEIKTKIELLNSARELAGLDTEINDTTLALLEDPGFINLHNETADDFFSRTLNPNPGIASLSSIDNFCTNLLKLPEPRYS